MEGSVVGTSEDRKRRTNLYDSVNESKGRNQLGCWQQEKHYGRVIPYNGHVRK